MRNHRLPAITRNLLLLVFAFSTTAFAQGPYSPEYGQFEGVGLGGASFAQDFEFPTSVSGSSLETTRTVGMHYASGYMIGGRISENLADYWAADLEYTFANQPLRFTNLTPQIQSLSLSQSVHHWTYNISFLPRRPTKRLRPYARVGAGAALFYIAGHSKDDALAQGVSLRDSWEFTFNYGGGAKYLVAEQASVIFDVKDNVSGVPSYGLRRSAQVINGAYVPGVSRNGFLNNWQISVGIAVEWND